MKINFKNLLIGILALPVIAFAQDAPTYQLEGNAPEGLSKVYLMYYDFNTDDAVLDSAKVENGKFSFSGDIHGASYSGLYFRNNYNDQSSNKLPDFWFYLNPGKTVIDTKSGNAKIVDGSQLTKDYLGLLSKVDKLREDYETADYKDYDNEIAVLNSKIEALNKERGEKFGAWEKAYNGLNQDFIRSNPDNSLSLLLLDGMTNGEAITPEVKTLFNGLSERLRQTVRGKRFTTILKSTSLVVGADAKEFQQADEDGNPVKLSDFRGKFVLIDFWASWCVPCREENPNVVKAYERYKDKNFDVLGVSLDNDKASWIKAIADDKLNWKNVSDLKGWKNEVAELYGIKAVPSNLLISPEGKILARDLRGEALEEALERFITN